MKGMNNVFCRKTSDIFPFMSLRILDIESIYSVLSQEILGQVCIIYLRRKL